VLKNGDGSIALGCSPADYAGSTGKIVVTMRGVCARVDRAIYGQQAGAAAVVMVNSTPDLPPYEGPITSNPDTGVAYNVTIPFLGAAGTAANTAALIAADGGTTTLSSITIPNTGYQNVASFSSGGPSNPDSAAKPEVIAPGVSVASAGIGTGNGFLTESGTSMATPMTAGVAALVQEAHPDWNGAQIKAAIENTADPTLNLDYNVRQSGAGVVQADDATTSSTLATTADGYDSLVFGYVPGTGAYTATKTFTLTNTDRRDVSYALSVDPDSGGLGGGAISVSPSSVTVRGNRSQTVSVTLTYSAAALAALPSMGSTGPGEVVSFGGAIDATPAAAPRRDRWGHGPGFDGPLGPRAGNGGQAQTLRVPFMVVPRGLSNITTGTPVGSSVPVTNSGIHEGTVDAYTWGLTDPNEGGSPVDIRDVGIQSFPDGSDRYNVFAINTWGRFTNPSVNEFDVSIDTNGDGAPDYTVVGIDVGAATSGLFNGQYASFVFNAAGHIVDAWGATAPMNGSVVELPFLSSDIGMDSTSGAFTYTVTGFSLVPGTLVDTTGVAKYDPYRPATTNGQFLDLLPGATDTASRAFSATRLLVTPALGLLYVNLDDANGAPQADEVPLAP